MSAAARSRRSRARSGGGRDRAPFAERASCRARAEGLAHGGRARPHVGQGRRDAHDFAASARRALGDHRGRGPGGLSRRPLALGDREGVRRGRTWGSASSTASFHMANGRGRACATFVSSVAIAASFIGSISGLWMAASNFARAATTAPPPPRAAASNSPISCAPAVTRHDFFVAMPRMRRRSQDDNFPPLDLPLRPDTWAYRMPQAFLGLAPTFSAMPLPLARSGDIWNRGSLAALLGPSPTGGILGQLTQLVGPPTSQTAR